MDHESRVDFAVPHDYRAAARRYAVALVGRLRWLAAGLALVAVASSREAVAQAPLVDSWTAGDMVSAILTPGPELITAWVSMACSVFVLILSSASASSGHLTKLAAWWRSKRADTDTDRNHDREPRHRRRRRMPWR